MVERNVLGQPHQLAADARLIRELDQSLAPLGLLDLASARQQLVKPS